MNVKTWMAALVVGAALSALPGHGGRERADPVPAGEPAMTSYLAPTYGLAGWLNDVGHGWLGEDGLDDGMVSGIGAEGGDRDSHDGPVPNPVGLVAPPLDESGRVYAATIPDEWPAQLTETQMRAALAEAGFTGARFEEGLAISFCESSLGTPYWHRQVRGDGGLAYGPFQIHWFPVPGWEAWGLPAVRAGYITEAEYLEPEHPIVNAKVARYIVESRGRWGGSGGWATCADLRGIE